MASVKNATDITNVALWWVGHMDELWPSSWMC